MTSAVDYPERGRMNGERGLEEFPVDGVLILEMITRTSGNQIATKTNVISFPFQVNTRLSKLLRTWGRR